MCIFLIVSSTIDNRRRPQLIETSGQGCYFNKIFIKLIELPTPAGRPEIIYEY